MAFEWKNYPKYDMTLGEYYARKNAIITPMENGVVQDHLTFTDVTGNTVTYTTDEITTIALNRHGNKRLLYMPDWFANNYNNTAEFKYTGMSKTDYVELYNVYYSSSLFQSWWNKSTQDNFNRIFQAMVAKYSPIENTDKYSEFTDSHTGTDTESKTGTDTLTKAGMNRLINTGTETTDINGKETHSKGGTDSVTYGKTDTHTVQLSDTTNITGQERDELTKDGSILENNDTDNYTFPFNGTNKEHTDHQDSYTNTRYGKYKDTDGNPQSDKYSETNTKTYTNRSDATVHSGNESNASTGSDSTTYGMTDTTEYTGRNNKLTLDTKNITEYDTTDTNEYNTTDTNTYNSNMEHIEHTHGNIGVTTNQAMIKEELSLRLGNSFLNILVDDLAAYICME